MSALKLRNIGPKSAAWLRQVGLRSAEDLAAVGAVGAFVKVRRAGFKPSLNLLYSLEGALVGCHWQEVPEARRQQLVAEYEVAAGGLPTARAGQMAGPVRETHMQSPDAGDHDSGDEVGEIRFGED
ncbi:MULTISPECIES: TfoX/Sxy family protein [Stenotrophomonas]|uniref:Transcriptional regulator n=1 Tax=Stenotrophomonas nitritireducens TaxID=83617 RepID=A0ABR5NGT8_9GAMM|nr:transcriptional regulator [Stenotrophomonas sp. Leaf70]KRG55027.1 transcriptional regulator [Stenotrophomonas nitritireducens]MBN8793605.1 TfoX/Sxy family protein [Stenotrophomonas nitritireducens]MBN8797176.1 TfoX/Sxy family protein [Stenotrophomonas nitritireducens]